MMIQKVTDPFPHLIIEDFYDQEELKLVWRELDFLTSPNILLPANLDGSAYSANALSLSLEGVYRDTNYSNIQRTHNNKILSKDIKDSFAELTPFHNHINSINKLNIKVKYYEDGHNYPKHLDYARFTGISYLYKEPKMFEGGDLYFNDFDYRINIKNNMFILFMGGFHHSVEPIKLKQDAYITGNGRYSITTFLDLDESIR